MFLNILASMSCLLGREEMHNDINTIFRAGLLDPHRRRRLYADIYTDRHRVERSVNDNGEIHDDALIQRNGQVHQLGLEIHNIKQVSDNTLQTRCEFCTKQQVRFQHWAVFFQ